MWNSILPKHGSACWPRVARSRTRTPPAAPLRGIARIVAGTIAAGTIAAGTIAPQNAPQTIVFQPAEGTRVISALTAAEMRQMLQGVVLHGTGRKAILEGYSSAGKTGTAQKVDPATGAYSKTK